MVNSLTKEIVKKLYKSSTVSTYNIKILIGTTKDWYKIRKKEKLERSVTIRIFSNLVR